MGSQRPKVPVMGEKDYRKPGTFVCLHDYWDTFLRRWNDENITRDEAKGLLHVVAERLDCDSEYPKHLGEDSRETCVRFLLHYAELPYRYDDEWQVIEKARKVLVRRVLLSAYMENGAPRDLVRDVLLHLMEQVKRKEPPYTQAKDRRIISAFAKRAFGNGRSDLRGKLAEALVITLFHSDAAARELRQGRL